MSSFLSGGISFPVNAISLAKTKGLLDLYFLTIVHEEKSRRIKKRCKKKEGRIFVGETDINCNKVLSKSRVKYIQTLFHKKFRDEEKRFIIEGPKIINEFLLVSPRMIHEIFAKEEWIQSNGNVLHNIHNDKLTAVTDDDLKKISGLPSPNQVLAIIEKQEYIFPEVSGNENILMLDEIQDPGNMGTIIRIADWFGINKIVCSKTCADIYNPKVIQSTMGSILRVKVLYTDLLSWCKNHAFLPVYAATLHGTSIYEIANITPGIILMGNESKGIKPELHSLSTTKITIPRIGEAESLNAAIAAGIILSHITQKTVLR